MVKVAKGTHTLKKQDIYMLYAGHNLAPRVCTYMYTYKGYFNVDFDQSDNILILHFGLFNV